ncbi:MAG: Ppx/GppA family phosphatase [Pseudomonadota bacterium]
MHAPRPATDFENLTRVGIIDVGSNSVRLVVFDGAARSPAYFYNEKVMCGLGRGLTDTGRLNGEGRSRAILAMDRFKALLDSFGVARLHTVATAAVRDASDGSAFVSEIAARTGIELTVATGAEEARLSAQGILLGWPEARGLVIDVGGASLEMAAVEDGRITRCMTSPLGPLQLMDLNGGWDAVRATVARHLARMKADLGSDFDDIFLVGGSFRAIAKIDMARRSYPLQLVHEYPMDRDHLIEAAAFIRDTSADDLSRIAGASSDRVPFLPYVAEALYQIVQVFAPKGALVSSYGIREGLLYEEMPPDLRARDPLIEACESMERGLARFPGFGRPLADWLRPLFPAGARWDRIVTAAGLLHDVSWRSHPSSRAEECFDNASRGNLTGLTHRGRVLLAIALLHRYRKSPKLEKYHALAPLLSADDQRSAQVLGYGLRLGAALAGGDVSVLRTAPLRLSHDRLALVLEGKNARFAGEAVSRRLDALAAVLGVAGVVTRR